MHRSGTSSVAGTLIRLGGDAPLHLMEPQADNERGFWESSVITDLNDEILAAGGSDWQDWRKFELERINRPAASAMRARADSVLLAEFGQAGLPVIKDPRMCRLMPFWSSVFRGLGFAWPGSDWDWEEFGYPDQTAVLCVFSGWAGGGKGANASPESGQALQKAQNGNAEVLSKVGMDLGLAPRRLGFGATSVWDRRDHATVYAIRALLFLLAWKKHSALVKTSSL